MNKYLATLFAVSFGTAAMAGGNGDSVAQKATRNSEATGLVQISVGKGPIKLGSEPTHIPLGDRPLADISADIGNAARVYLVLEHVRFDQPPGILFEVLIGDESAPGSYERVGRFNLFETRELLSFDITERFRSLVASNSRGMLVVTIRPAVGARSEAAASGSPEWSRLHALLEQAAVSIGVIRLDAR
ncbi:hypothetical protein [Nitrobacter vulgaris]|uniref:hypothetical protein n=1 Tax=Nitrobacter vulgaris TaxID=29421 RepID=UPI00286D59B1|nr:hypothetical protein [Nitrobacter vulgaris]